MTRAARPSSRAQWDDAPPLAGFPPSIGHTLHVLILGSFPGARSLALGEYYANPQNRFWRAVAAVTGAAATATYAERTAALHRTGVGLWDVLAHCERQGSLDQAILPGSEVPNDIGRVVATHAELRAILLNGRSVAALFDRWVIPRRLWPDAGVAILTLPSTSPAHAAARPESVIAEWSAALRGSLPATAPKQVGVVR